MAAADSCTNPLTGQPFTAYFWANSAQTNENFNIRNTEDFQYLATDGSVIDTADPRRNYKGLMLVLSSSLRQPIRLPVLVRALEGRGQRRQHWVRQLARRNGWTSPNTASSTTSAS